MTYQPLARKYRPATFRDVIGQDAVSKALANAIKLRREPHAVIFAGTRGIGKTTTARLYAKSLNCLHGPTAEPCNHCDSCVAINKGHHEDVMEIDGASNTGVGDVRALQETIEYVPQRSQFKIYIIDEVHMLSQAAFNALLKTLEEPPPHVVFIFATTELGRVPQTIISRCQVFHLQKLALALIRQRLVNILQTEAVPFDDKAVTIIAREGHGSMRDALTLLDQAIAHGGGQVSLSSLGALVSNLSSTPYLELLTAMTQRHADAALAVIATLDQGGAEFTSVVEETAKFARHAFVVRDLGPAALDAALLGLDDEEMTQLQNLAAQAPAFDLNRIFRTLARCRSELDGSALDRYVLENYLFEWCLDPGLPDLTALLASQDASGSERVKPVRPDAAGSIRQTTPSPSLSPATGTQPAAAATTNHKMAAPQRMRDVMAEIKSPATPTSSMRPGATIQAPPPMLPTQQTALTPQATPPQHQGKTLPPTWRALVEAWKLSKPLQARKLEEVHPITYGATEIVVAVQEAGFASKSLLQRDEQLKMLEQFRALFGFTGRFTVIASEATPNHQTQDPKADTNSELLPETLLHVKERESGERRQRLVESARQAAFTQEVLAVFNATIEDVVIRE